MRQVLCHLNNIEGQDGNTILDIEKPLKSSPKYKSELFEDDNICQIRSSDAKCGPPITLT